MFFEKIFRECQKRNIKYLVVGGVAVNLHGYPRATADLDIMLSFDQRNIRKFIAMMKFMGFKPKIPVDLKDLADARKRSKWVREKRMKVFSVYNPRNEMEHIDIMVLRCIDFESAHKRKKVVLAGPLKIPIVSIEDLIKLKKIAGRERDEIDIKVLERLKALTHEKEKG